MILQYNDFIYIKNSGHLQFSKVWTQLGGMQWPSSYCGKL